MGKYEVAEIIFSSDQEEGSSPQWFPPFFPACKLGMGRFLKISPKINKSVFGEAMGKLLLEDLNHI